MNEPDQTLPSLRNALRQFWRLLLLVRPYWAGLATGLGLGALVGIIGLVVPYLSKLFIDTVYPSRDASLMHVLVIAVATVTTITAVLGTLRGFYAQTVSARLASAMTLLVFNHLQHLPIQFYDEHRVGEVLSRFGDTRAALSDLANVLQVLFGSGIYLLIVPPFLFLLNWKLAVVSITTIPLTTAVSTLAGRVGRRYWKASAEAAADLSALQVEVFSQIRTIKSLAVERHIYESADGRVRESLRTQLQAAGIGTLVQLFNSAIYTAGTAVFTWYAWTLILRGEMRLGEFVAFSAYVGFLVGPVGQFAQIFSGFQHTAVTLARMFEYLDCRTEQDPRHVYKPPTVARRARGELCVESVSFGYRSGRRVLDDISLTLVPGKVTAVVGPSGAGKSSLLRLMCRMLDPDSGRCRLDGVPFDSVPLSDLRQQVSVVWQEFAVLRGTVWENLTYGLTVPPSEVDIRVQHAIRVCRLAELVRDLPQGIHTPVAEWGATLSGGQRQRLAVARALVRQTPVLLLDEATSQVDAATEDDMLRGIFAGCGDSALLFVTHRVTTAAFADQICVLDEGRVVGLGSHQELMSSCGLYRRLISTANSSETRPIRASGDPNP